MKRAALSLTLVLAIAACSGGAVDSGSPDGSLDCDGDRWTLMVDLAGAGGEPTPFDAMTRWAAGAYPELTHTIHVVTARTGTVVVDQTEVALITVDELADETFAMQRVDGCPGFERS